MTRLDDIVAGALFDFCGRMTTCTGPLLVGASQHPGPVLDLLRDWATERGLNLDGADVQRWQQRLGEGR